MRSTSTRKSTSSSLPTLTHRLTKMAECVVNIVNGELKVPRGVYRLRRSCGEAERIYKINLRVPVPCSSHPVGTDLCISISLKPKRATSPSLGTSKD